MSAGQYTPGPDRLPEREATTPPANPAQPSGDRAASLGGAPSYPAREPRTPATGTSAAGTSATTAPGGATPERKVTRAGVIWAAVVAALALLILLIVFILQNQEQALVKFLGFEGSVPLGMALFIAAVTGGVLVAVAGGARILQLRSNAHRARVRQRK
ncbi:lipopolysaccharide assembly LapA domain-containing protein [Pseudarthrobacter sp. NIBRBAC000502770]|uniref:LapA family protein n=1 Tax=Pseudarthrobacter sp. NIBRBAC000502770 TaxID=2590785 RepID=UPI00114024F1|nr:LapA family protein [Pseudarthrobacter sp. NIBRBAC000502770]QDG90352.1 LapA family protein [Pseudarthrobacter sp. NIBRBAC000502770]